MIRLEQVQFRLGSRQLLQPLDLQIPQGQVCGLIGHNGSGKSTLIKLLARQQPATGGRILLDGQDLASYSSREFARRVATQVIYLEQGQIVEMGSAQHFVEPQTVRFAEFLQH